MRFLVALVLLCSVVSAHADDKPWAVGVSTENQKAALATYQEANALFEEGKYLEALPKYEAALRAWDHPGIHFNTAVCLINLDRSVDAYVHLQKAMAFGEAPLGKDLYTQGKNYQRILNQQVGTLEVQVKEPGASVKLDGKEIIAPGTTTTTRVHVLATEPHQLVAEKDDPRYEPATQTIRLEPGKTTTIVLELKLRARGGRLTRRWPRWMPWSVVVTGGVVAAIGVPLLVSAKSGFEDYDTQFGAACPQGCLDTDPALAMANETKDHAELRQTLAHGGFIAGGALVAIGIGLVVLNQPRLGGAQVTPMVGADRAGAALSMSW